MTGTRKPSGPPGRLVHVGTHALHVLCNGNGAPAVIFDPALGASSVSWSLVLPEVAKVTRACAYDRAGFGWSDGGPLPRTAGVIADELYTLVTSAGIPPPYVLVGHSFGALVMRILAARRRDACAGLVLVDPAHPEEWLDPGEHERRQIERGVRLCRYGTAAARFGVARLISGLVGIGALAPARALVRAVSRGGLARADEEILAPVWKLPPETRRSLRHFWVRREFFEALGSQIASIRTSASQAEGAGIGALVDLPLVVIGSSTASARRVALHQALARSSSKGRYVVAANSGHWVPVDEPAVVIREVLEVVRSLQ